MKKSIQLLLTGSLFITSIFFSCTKDPMISDESNDANEIYLKSAPSNFDLSPIEQLGRNLYFDKISSPNSMACADCHLSKVGFTGPTPGINIHGSVYRGADAQNFGNRKPPSAAYASFSPILHIYEDGTFEGGMFWDGRATGERLGKTTAEQALGPFLNPAEHNLAAMEDVLKKIAGANYLYLWKEVWNENFAYDTPETISKNYHRMGLAIAAF